MKILENALREVKMALGGTVSESKLIDIQETIRNFAITSAVVNAIGGAFPGGPAIMATLAQSGMIYAIYVKINKHLNINMDEDLLKVVAVACVSGIVANFSIVIVSYAAAAVISFIPIFGSAIAATANAAMGYIFMYVSAIVYLKLIANLARPDGSIQVPQPAEAKRIIKDIIAKMDKEELVQEGRNSYKQAEQAGSIAKAFKNPRCPSCGAPIENGQKYCSNCGSALF